MGFFDLMSAFIDVVWDFFTELHIPGLSNVTFASLFVAAALATLGVRLVFFLYGIASGGGGDAPRTSSTRSPKISKERMHDEF